MWTMGEYPEMFEGDVFRIIVKVPKFGPRHWQNAVLVAVKA